MFVTLIRLPMLAVASALVFALSSAAAGAADRAAYSATCEKNTDKTKCACVADKVDAAFKDKELKFAYDTLANPIGEIDDKSSGLSEKEEDAIVDQTFSFMKECGVVK